MFASAYMGRERWARSPISANSFGMFFFKAPTKSSSGSHIYILGSHTGTLYIGVTSNLYLRVMQHKEGTLEGFTAAYGCKRLLYFEG